MPIPYTPQNQTGGALPYTPGVPPVVPTADERSQRIAQGQPVSVNSDNPNPSFLGGLLRAPVKLAARATTNLINAEQVVRGKPLTQPFSGQYLGNVRGIGSGADNKYDFSGANLKDALGTGLEASSYLVGGEGAAPLVEDVGSGLIKRAAIQGLKTGATTGVLGGAGGALEQNKGVGGFFADTALGGLTGGLTGGVLGIGGALAGKATNLAKNLISPTEDAVNKAKANIAKQYETALPLTPLQKAKETNLLNKTGDNVYTTLAKYGINLGSEKAPAQLQEVSDQFANATQHAQLNENGYFNVDEIKANAFDQINKNIPSETARNAAKAKVTGEIDALVKANPKAVIRDVNGNMKVNSDLVERLRQTGNSWTNFNSADPEKVGMSTGYALSNAVRDQVDKEGTFPAYREANKEWGKVIHTQEVLNRIDASGKQFKIPGGLSGSISRKVLSGALGFHTAGIGGAILGELGSETGAKILANPELRTYFDRQIIENFGNKKATPDAVARLEQQVREYIEKQSTLKQLPAPSAIPLNAEQTQPKPLTPPNIIGNNIKQNSQILQNTKQLPAPESIQLGAESPQPQQPAQVVPAAKNPVSVNPQTGKFQTSYTSGVQANVDNAPIARQSNISPNITNIPPTVPPNPGKVQLGALLGTAGATGAAALGLKALSKNKTATQSSLPQNPQSIVKPVLVPGAVPINTVKKEIAQRETGGEKTPYTATNTNSNGSTDYGKYQVNQSMLDTYYQKLMGEKTTPQQFLASPAKQEEFFTRMYNHAVKDLGVKSINKFLTLWHCNGFSKINKSEIQKLQKSPEMKSYLKK